MKQVPVRKQVAIVSRETICFKEEGIISWLTSGIRKEDGFLLIKGDLCKEMSRFVSRETGSAQKNGMFHVKH